MKGKKKVPRDESVHQDRFYIGGSNIGVLAGLHPTKTPLDVYNRLMRITPEEPQDDLMEKGRVLEPIAAAKFTKDTGRELRQTGIELVHPKYPFIRGHEDYELVENNHPFEIKCPTLGKFSQYKAQGLTQMQIAQLQLYMGLKKTAGGEWSLFCADLWKQISFPYDFDPDGYGMLIEISVKFWRDHVEKKVPPLAPKPDKTLVEFYAAPGEVVRVDTDEYREAMSLLRQAKEFLSEGETLESLAKDRVKDAVGRVKGKYDGPGGKIYWTDQAGRRTFDHKSLAGMKPLDPLKVMEVLRTEFGAVTFKKIVAALKDCDMDLTAFFKQGQPFETMRPYFTAEEDE
jgi:putative phage-type endonuclease